MNTKIVVGISALVSLIYVVGDEIAANPGTVMVTFIGSTRTGGLWPASARGSRGRSTWT